MTPEQLWAQLSALVFFAGVWMVLAGVVFLAISMAMHGLGVPE